MFFQSTNTIGNLKKLRKTNSKFSKSNQSKSLKSFLELWLEVFLPTIELRQNALFASVALNKLNFRGGWKNRWLRERVRVRLRVRESVCVFWQGVNRRASFTHSLLLWLVDFCFQCNLPHERIQNFALHPRNTNMSLMAPFQLKLSASACITKTYKSTELDLSFPIKRAFMFQSCLPSRSQLEMYEHLNTRSRLIFLVPTNN